MVAKLKTRPNDADVGAFIAGIDDDAKREDAERLLALMADVTGEPATMWGQSIVGFGSYRYRYASGHQGEWMLTGFSPRKRNLTVYIMPGFATFESVLKQLGKHKTSRSCLYVQRLSDIDVDVLRTLIANAVDIMRQRYPGEAT